MKAVYKTKPEHGLEFKENIDLPNNDKKIGENEVLVKVLKAGICGTDIHIFKWDPWAQGRMTNRIPLIVGHELAGKVVEVGSNVTSVAEGDLVSAETHIACGKCYFCKTGRKAVCQNTAILGVDINGVYADYTILPEENAWVNDPGLPPSIAAMLEPLGNAFHTALPEHNIEDIVGKKVLVTGAGPIGLFTIALCKQIGAEVVYTTEINPFRIELAKKMGSDEVINPIEEDSVKRIMDLTNDLGVDVFLEISGHPQSLINGLEVLAPGGRVSLLGIYGQDVTMDINNLLVFKGARLFGITGRRMFQTWYQLKGLLNRSEFRSKIAQVITDQFDLKDIQKAMNHLLQDQKSAKVILNVN